MAIADLPLLQQEHVTYLGAYRCPLTQLPGDPNSDPFSFAEGRCVYNPVNNSLIMVGSHSDLPDTNIMPLCEITFPVDPPSTSSNLGDVPACTWVAPSKSVCSLVAPLEGTRWYSHTYGGGTWTNGSRVGAPVIDTVNNRLALGAWLYYSEQTPETRPSHFSVPLDFNTANSGNTKQLRMKQGTYPVSTGGTITLGGAGFAVYATKVPATWQSPGEFSGITHLCGTTNVNVTGRCSSSPAAWSLDPTYFSLPDGDPALATPQASTMFLHTNSNDLSWQWEGPGNGVDMYNGNPQVPFNATNGVGGATAVDGTRTMMYTGRVGTGFIYYGNTNDNYPGVVFTNGVQDDKQPGRGYHSVALKAGFRKLPAFPVAYDDVGSPGNYGVYTQYAWLFDAVDLLAVKSGAMHPRNVMPYAHFAIPPTIQHIASSTSGQAWDPATRRLFVISLWGTDVYGYSYRPLIHVYNVEEPTPGGGPTILGNPGELMKWGKTT